MSDFVIPAWFEFSSLIVLSLILIFDLLLVVRRPHVPSPKESALWVAFYVTLALIFAGLMVAVAGPDAGGEFVAGWLTEYSLSIDNLFVFVIIMSQFAVPKKMQQEVLMIGIILALLFRGAFILLGATLIENFSWIFYIFGLFLLITAAQQALSGRDDDEARENALIQFLRKRIAITDEYHGMKMRTVVDGKKIFTPLLIVLIAIGTTDLIFALDSIPAIFGITQSPFIVFTANVFALMGLRQLYFLLGHLVDKLEFLKYGIAFILAFIGVKLVFHAMHENELPIINSGMPIEWVPDIGTFESLAVIVGAMALAVGASLIKLRIEQRAEQRAEQRPEQCDGPTALSDPADEAEGDEETAASERPASR